MIENVSVVEQKSLNLQPITKEWVQKEHIHYIYIYY